MKTLCLAQSPILLVAICATARTHAEDDYRLEISRRINAHGDEFMGLTLTSDSRRLIVGTETGKLIIWGIPERRILKQLEQGSPVHCVVALRDSDEFVAAGGPHSGSSQGAIVRKWQISSGSSEVWKGIGGGTILSLATDPTSGLVAAGNATGELVVWNSSDGSVVFKNASEAITAGLAVNGREVYMTRVRMTNEDGPSPNTIERGG